MKVCLVLTAISLYIFVHKINFEFIFWSIQILLHWTQTPLESLSVPDHSIAEEAKFEVTKLIKFYGYPAESHTILTRDGYILKVHRIPFGKNNKTRGGYPVLLQHGILCGSSQWVNNKEESLGFILANIGYDVWMGNFRGNCHSKYHLSLKKYNTKFWNFGIDKLAKYDIPSMIQYIRFVTGYDQILTIGHSMGFATLANALASQPYLKHKIKGVIGLGPILRFRYIFSLVRNFHIIMKAFELSSSKSFFGHSKLWEEVLLRFCPASHSYYCCNMISLFNGYNPDIYNESRIPIYVNHCTCGNSIHIMYHWFQTLGSYNVHGYDYGKEINMKEYGQPYPIKYNYSKIQVPVAIMTANNDGFSSLVENVMLSREIPTVIERKVLPGIFTSHLDYLVTQRSTATNTIITWLQKLKEY